MTLYYKREYKMLIFFYFFIQLLLVQLATTEFDGKDIGLSDLKRNCPSIQNDFWQCMNRTLQGKRFVKR